MPYIKQSERESYLPVLAAFVDMTEDRPAHLAFAIMSLCVGYLRKAGVSFATLKDVIGVLETTKLEFAARRLQPYEEEKRLQNGDIE